MKHIFSKLLTAPDLTPPRRLSRRPAPALGAGAVFIMPPLNPVAPFFLPTSSFKKCCTWLDNLRSQAHAATKNFKKVCKIIPKTSSI